MITKLLFTLLICSYISSFSQTTFVPDDNFEQALIDLGYDDILDDFVLTTNLSNVIQLDLNQTGVQDLTGLAAFLSLEWLRIDNRASDLAPIENIDVTQNLNLEVLLLPGNNIKEIDLSKNEKLRGLDLESNQIEVIDLTYNHNLQSVNLFDNKLKDLDLSKNEKLELYLLSNNELTSLNLQNGNNTNFVESVELTGNPNLKCIQVDDAEFSSNNQYWRKDETAIYSEDCSSPEDSDKDGVPDDFDLCSNTPLGTLVDEDGCELSIADLVLENILISIGSDPCLLEPSCFISMKSLKNLPLNISIETGEQEVVFDGILNQANPIALNDLPEGDYTIAVAGNEFLPIDYSWNVSFYADNNQIATNVGITEPNQTYTIGVSGSTTYLVDVNGETTTIEFDSIEENQLEIPLVVGINNITVNGIIACDSEEKEDDIAVKGTGMLLFPTLSDGLITIENGEEKQIHGITVTGLNGIRTKYEPIQGSPKKMLINMRGAAKGMYIVRIQQANGKAILKKILIQ